MDAKTVIELLQLKPLPGEGGYFRETYRASGLISEEALKGEHEGDRHFSTAIYYLITLNEFSALHRLPQDEFFHFYLGDPVEILQIDPSGAFQKTILGPDLVKGHTLQWLIPGGHWQGLSVVPGGQWSLLGATVSPGLDFSDFSLGERKKLLMEFPQHEKEIMRFTRG